MYFMYTFYNVYVKWISSFNKNISLRNEFIFLKIITIFFNKLFIKL